MHAIMMEMDRNELLLAEILADSGSESDDNTGSSSYVHIIGNESRMTDFIQSEVALT